MASTNFNPFEGWFSKPPNPIPPLNNLLEQFFQKTSVSEPNFAIVRPPRFFGKKEQPPPQKVGGKPRSTESTMEQYYEECSNSPPDYRHARAVDKALEEENIFEKIENPTAEEVEDNEEWWSQFRSKPIVKFLSRAEQIADELNRRAVERNKKPYHKEDAKLWNDVPNVIGLDGRPVPRKAIKTEAENDRKFWDFTRQFFFGLWGFRQRPYPPCKPNDFAQTFGYKKLENRYYDFVMKTGGYFYKDRLGRTRGPMELINLRTAWGAGIVDKDTFVWMEDMDEWAPIHMIYGLEDAVATWDARFGAAATAFIHKVHARMPQRVPLKGHEKKTYQEMQQEAIESKKRDLAVLKANNGIWPGVRIPSHALFLWASGPELTPMLEGDHMPNKFIPKDLRIKLAKLIPDLRPWEVLNVEQAMDRIVYDGEWYRKPLSAYRTGPPYIRENNEEFKHCIKIEGNMYKELEERVLEKYFPAYYEATDIVLTDMEARIAAMRKKRDDVIVEKMIKGTAF